MLEQLPRHIKRPCMNDVILAADGLDDLPSRPGEIFHQENALAPMLTAQECLLHAAMTQASRRQRSLPHEIRPLAPAHQRTPLIQPTMLKEHDPGIGT